MVMVGVVVYSVATDTRVGLVVRDANQVTGARAWTGLVSTLGNGLWAVSAGMLLVTIGALRSAATSPPRALTALFALTCLLYADDSLLLHDEVLPSVGVHEIFFVGFYAMAGLAALILALPALRSSDAILPFAAALALFAVSVGVDLVDPRSWGPDVLFAVEDGAKFVGIGLWTDSIYRLGRYSVGSAS